MITRDLHNGANASLCSLCVKALLFLSTFPSYDCKGSPYLMSGFLDKYQLLLSFLSRVLLYTIAHFCQSDRESRCLHHNRVAFMRFINNV